MKDDHFRSTLTSLNPCFNGRCTRTLLANLKEYSFAAVLILVLMEDALVQMEVLVIEYWGHVLILVLMEDALVHSTQSGMHVYSLVLILVLMEDALVR